MLSFALRFPPMKKGSPPRRSVHQPVMYREVLRLLELSPGTVVVDGTTGAGGHSRMILDRLDDDSSLICLDRDPWMLDLARPQLQDPRCKLVRSSYAELPEVLRQLDRGPVDRILLDLGWSSDQLTDESRGFAFSSTGPLDLRFDTSNGVPASQVLAEADVEQLTGIFEEYGEEKGARRIAERIVGVQRTHPIGTAEELSRLCAEALPGSREKNPATKVFQALRIHVNDELGHLERALNESLSTALAPGGRLLIITFHSLEDRMVKQAFRKSDLWQAVTERPVAPAADEVRFNPRARSAKLRVATRKP